MAESPKKSKFEIMNVLAAAGGGAAVNFGLDMLEDNIEMFEKKPILGPLLMEGLGVGLSYFDNKGGALHSAGLGMVGAATSELLSLQKEKSSQGFSRVNVNKKRFLSQEEKEALRNRFKKRKMEGSNDDDSDDDDNT